MWTYDVSDRVITMQLPRVSMTQTSILSGYKHDKSVYMHVLSPNYLHICVHDN